MRFFLLAKIYWQQNTAGKHPPANIYAGLRAPQTLCARLVAWTASQNCVLLFSQQPSFRRQPANNLTSAVIFFTEQISAFRQPTSFYFSPIPAGKIANQSAKTTTKKGSRSFLRKMLLHGFVDCCNIACGNFGLLVGIYHIQRPVQQLVHLGRIFLSTKTY